VSGRPGPDVSAHAGAHDRSGWGTSLRPGRRTALLCIDMVRAYHDPGGRFELPSLEPLRSAARVLAAAREAGVLVAHSGVRYAAGGVDGGSFVRKVPGLLEFVGDTEAGAFRAEVAPRPGEVVLLKQMPSAFFGTTLASTLTAAGVDTVLVCGVSTSGCVRATVVDAMSHGFTPFVVADACGDRSPEVHDSNLRDMAAKYADVVDEAWALAHLRSRSGT
jgi:maleamate amidohydrolase